MSSSQIYCAGGPLMVQPKRDAPRLTTDGMVTAIQQR